ncbi:MAG: methionine--tRNA ligase [Candidatus Omnitrophota bacterium]
MKKEDKFYITTAIDYPSGPPHIGHAYEKIIADVIARWQRKKGKDVFFLTGTDEHGQKMEKYAALSQESIEDFVDRMSGKFMELRRMLDISCDDFIRTTQERHIKAAERIFSRVLEKGDIYKGKYEGFYCIDCESYYLERDLKEGNCPIHARKPDWMEAEGYFFKMSKYQQAVLDYINKNENFIMPKTRRNEIINRIKEGVRDLSVSRSNFKWGIPLPNDKDQVIFVWFDALINYISALDWPEGDRFKTFWPADMHIIGKDILWFHAMVWPAILLAAEIELPRCICVHGFIKLGGEKISKSKSAAGTDIVELIEKYGPDSLRYFFLREFSLGEDGNFSEAALIRRINSDLANDLGNLVHRTLTMVEKYYLGKVPDIKREKLNSELLTAADTLPETIEKEMAQYNFNQALAKIWELVNAANKFVEDTKPWVLFKEKKAEQLSGFIFTLVYVINRVREQLAPFMPQTAEKIRKQFAAQILKKGEPLFPRIENVS